MSQHLIKKHLVKYLNIKIKNIQEEIEKNNNDKKKQEKIKELQTHLEILEEKLAKGHCFGFAICDAALTAEGYEAWWHQILYLVTNWNENNNAALDAEVDLRSYLPASHQSNDNRRKTLGDLFEMVLNYILFTHAAVIPGMHFIPNDISQEKIVQAGNPFFEILINKQIKRIEDRGCETVHVSELVRFLNKNKNAISGNMCLLHNENHTVNIRYQNYQWYIYDSNYDHTSVNTIVKKFDTVEQLVEEVKKNNKHCVAVDVMTLRKDKKIVLSHYGPELTEAEVIRLLEPVSFYIMIINTSPDLNTSHTFAKIHGYIKESKGEAREKVLKTLAQILDHKMPGEINGLQFLAKNAPHALPRFLEFAEDDAEFIKKLAQVITYSDKDHWNGFHYLAQFTTTGGGMLFKMAKNHRKILLNPIMQTLEQKIQSGSNGFQFMARYFPYVLLKFLRMVEDDGELSKKLAEMITSSDENGWNGLHYMVRYVRVPFAFNILFHLAKNNDDIMDAIAAALVKPDNDQESVLLMPKNGLRELFDLVKDNRKKLLNPLLQSLKHKTKSGYNAFQLLTKNHAFILDDLLELGQDNAEFSKELAEMITSSDPIQQNGLHYIAKFAPTKFKKIFQLAEKSEELTSAIASALVQPDNEENAVLHLMAMNGREVAALFRLADRHNDIADAIVKASKHKNKYGKTSLYLLEQASKDMYKKAIDLIDISETVHKIQAIINSEAYWRTRTHSPQQVFPKTVESLRKIDNQNINHNRSQLISEFKKAADQSIKYKEQHPIMYVLNSGRRSNDARDFYKLLSDLPENKNQARVRLDTMFNQVLELNESNINIRKRQAVNKR